MGKINVLEEVKGHVPMLCKLENNVFGLFIWEEHILPVVEHSQRLAQEMKNYVGQHVDEEVCVISALLHDIGSIVDSNWVDTHHEKGAQIAENLLSQLGYDPLRIEKVKEAIYHHRGICNRFRPSVEAMILASADGRAHIEHPDRLIGIEMRSNDGNFQQAIRYVRRKIITNYGKLFDIEKIRAERSYLGVLTTLDALSKEGIRDVRRETDHVDAVYKP